MTDFLSQYHLWIKSLHIISVVAWMAGMLYLPRLYVYHVERCDGGTKMDAVFIEMEHKLLRVIMNPAMVAVWIFGLMLVMTPGAVDWNQYWPWIKAGAVVAMTWFHHWLARRRKDFLVGENRFSGRFYRIVNEVPTVLLVVIVLSVVVRF